MFYTRAGHFFFDEEGYYVSTDGYRVQGYLYDATGTNLIENPVDIQVDQNSMIPPQVTGQINMVLNLDAAAAVTSAFNIVDPGDTSNFSTAVTIYDTLGDSHQIQVYFTKPADQTWAWNAVIDGADVQGGTPGDLYQYGNGQLVFDTSGQLTTSMSPSPNFGRSPIITAGANDVFDSVAVLDGDDEIVYGTGIPAGGVDSVFETAWTSGTSFAESSGVYTGATDQTYAFTIATDVTLTLTGGNADVVVDWDKGGGVTGHFHIGADYVAGTPLVVENGLLIAFSAGDLFAGETFEVDVFGAERITAGQDGILQTNPANDDVLEDAFVIFANGLTAPETTIDFTDTTQYGSGSAIQVLNQDGYAAGNLSGVGIDQEGNLVASFTNGLRKNMARMALADFACLNGLARKGDTLYQGTTSSGDALNNKPGVGGMGTIASSMLEESNVDLAGEFIKMILIQRGYQANTKVITTTDEMLAQLMNIR